MSHPTTCALEDLRSLVLGDHVLYLQKEALLSAFADGSFDEMHFDAALRQLFGDDMLVHEVAGKSIRAVHEQEVDETIGCSVTQ